MPIILLSLLLAFAAWIWLRTQPPQYRKGALIKLLVVLAIGGAIFLAATGRLYVLMGLLAAMVPFIRRFLPGLLLGRLGGALGKKMGQRSGGSASAGQQSRVNTEVLEMTLDHDSGEMGGRVLTGPMSGRDLSDLGEQEFLELLRYCRQKDADSARVLETYLDRRFGDSWRADDVGEEQEDAQAGSQSSGPMSEREALEVLGLESGASRDDIVQAHRRLMQKLHPDRGGSTYLAARINEAKKVLLD